MSGPQNTFGAILRKRRLELRKTLREVADAIGKTAVYVSDVERGRRGAFNPGLIDYDRLAEVLDMNVGVLVTAAQDERGVVELRIADLDGATSASALRLMRMVNEGAVSAEQMDRIMQAAEEPPEPKD